MCIRDRGGGSGEDEKGTGDSMHRSVFHAVENASEIRDLILARLQFYRQAGLGEPDDANQSAEVPVFVNRSDDVDALVAAQELLGETKALRAELS